MCSEKIAAWKEIIDCKDEHLSGHHSNSLVAAYYFPCFRPQGCAGKPDSISLRNGIIFLIISGSKEVQIIEAMFFIGSNG